MWAWVSLADEELREHARAVFKCLVGALFAYIKGANPSRYPELDDYASLVTKYTTTRSSVSMTMIS